MEIKLVGIIRLKKGRKDQGRQHNRWERLETLPSVMSFTGTTLYV